MSRVLILDTPSPLSCRSGVAEGSEHLMIRVRLDHYMGHVFCKPCELAEDTLPAWVPVLLRLWIKRIQRKWRDHHENRAIARG